MDELYKIYLPMTESMYYILSAVVQPRHGYGIMLHVKKITNGRITLAAGTIYNSLSRLSEDGLVFLTDETQRRKTYQITQSGREILIKEVARLRELVGNAPQELL